MGQLSVLPNFFQGTRSSFTNLCSRFYDFCFFYLSPIFKNYFFSSFLVFFSFLSGTWDIILDYLFGVFFSFLILSLTSMTFCLTRLLMHSIHFHVFGFNFHCSQYLPFSSSLPRWPRCPVVGQTKVRWQELHLIFCWDGKDPYVRAIFCCFSKRPFVGSRIRNGTAGTRWLHRKCSYWLHHNVYI